MDINYQEVDNIVLDSTVNEAYNSWSKTTDVEKIDDQYNISYDNLYPKLTDVSVVDSTGAQSQEQVGIAFNERMVIATGTELTLSIPFIDDNIKEFAAKYFPDDDKYKFGSCELFMRSEKVGAYNSNYALVQDKIYNTEDANIVDYLLDEDLDFPSQQNIYVWGNTQGSMQREYFLSPRPEWEPKFIFECKDSTGLVTYVQIYFDKLPQSYGGLSDYFEMKYNDMTSYDSTSDMMSIRYLPMILKNPIFQKYCRDELAQYAEVNILMYIDNRETEPDWQEDIQIYSKNQKWEYKGCAIAEIDLSLDKYDNIKAIHLAHILQLRIDSRDFVSYYNTVDENFFLYVNDNISEFTRLNAAEFQVEFNTKNYFNLNNNITPFDFEYGDTTAVTIKIVITQPEHYSSKVYTIDDIGLALSRNQRIHSQQKLVYSQDAQVEHISRLEKYYITDSTYAIKTEVIVDIEHLNTQFFHQIENTVQGLDEQDVITALDLIKNVDISVFYRNINNVDTYFYVKFNYDKTIWYLRKYLENDIIKNIVDSMIISISVVNQAGGLSKKLISIDLDNMITSYIDNVDITYVFKHVDGDQIININGIFNKKSIDAVKNQGDTATTDEYYIPNDTIIVTNTQKTN